MLLILHTWPRWLDAKKVLCKAVDVARLLTILDDVLDVGPYVADGSRRTCQQEFGRMVESYFYSASGMLGAS